MNYFRLWLIVIPCLSIFSGTIGFNVVTSGLDRVKLEFNRGDPVFAAEFLFASSVGYSSNPALESKTDTGIEPKGSPFSIHTLSMAHGFTVADKFIIDILSSATYQDLWELPDNHQFDIGLSLASADSGKRFNPYLFISERFYRDAMVKTDERDEFTIGAGGEILLSGRYSLFFEYAWQRLSYLEDSPLFYRAGGDFLMNDTNTQVNSAQDSLNDSATSEISVADNVLDQIFSAREDVNMLLKSHLDIFVLPSLTASVGLKYEYLVSSLDEESFRQLTPNIKIVWDFASQWQFMCDTQLQRRNYFDIYELLEDSSNANAYDFSDPPPIPGNSGNRKLLNIRKINYTTSVNLRVSRFWNNIELFSDLFIEHGEYPLNNESYNQQVAQCGFSWSF